MRRPVVKQGRGRSVAVAFFSVLWLRGWPIWRLPCWAWMRRKPLREDPPGVPVRADVRPVRAVVRRAPAGPADVAPRAPVAADRPVLGGVRHVPAGPADLAGPVPRVPADPADPALPVLADPADPVPRGPADLAGLVIATGVGHRLASNT